jgi:long-chain fatty acid transport protein
MKKRHGHPARKLAGLLATIALASVSQPIWAGAFQIETQNASNLGTAYAGAASMATDASTGFYNPAGLTRLGTEQIAFSGVLINSRTTVTPSNTLSTFGAPFSALSSKSNGYTLVPGLHYAKRINGNWVFGFNVASPFGLKNNYKVDSGVRYMATRSDLRTVDISPSLAYDFNNGFSLGAGVDVMYIIAKLDTRIAAPGAPNAATDGFQENTASRFGLGWHVGALYEFTDSTRMGVHYRSQVHAKLKGDSVQQTVLGSTSQGVSSDIKIPETVTVSLYHDINDQWAVMADAFWTHWKRFDQLVLKFDDQSTLTTPEQYKDRIRMALGAAYQYSEQWKFSVGTAADKTPVQDSYRNVRLPDQNRYWGSLGAQYRFNKNLALDVGYAHIFSRKANINDKAPVATGTFQGAQRLQGTGRSKADLMGVQLTWDIV